VKALLLLNLASDKGNGTVLRDRLGGLLDVLVAAEPDDDGDRPADFELQRTRGTSNMCLFFCCKEMHVRDLLSARAFYSL
jgi:hypothetical protein